MSKPKMPTCPECGEENPHSGAESLCPECFAKYSLGEDFNTLCASEYDRHKDQMHCQCGRDWDVAFEAGFRVGRKGHGS